MKKDTGMMKPRDLLKNKTVLVVDDEPDVLETLEDLLDMCLIHTADNYDIARQYLLSYTYDVVILDIMGVKGFDLLKISVSRGFPTVMLTAHAFTSESIKKSIKLGAISFLPKEKMSEIADFLTDVIINDGNSAWRKLFHRLKGYFNERFGSDWKEKDRFFKDFEKEIMEEKMKNRGY